MTASWSGDRTAVAVEWPTPAPSPQPALPLPVATFHMANAGWRPMFRHARNWLLKYCAEQKGYGR